MTAQPCRHDTKERRPWWRRQLYKFAYILTTAERAGYSVTEKHWRLVMVAEAEASMAASHRLAGVLCAPAAGIGVLV